MGSGSSLSRRAALLITIISPALLGFVRCVVGNIPTIATAHIEHIEPTFPRVGDFVQATGSGSGTPPLQFTWDFGDGTLAAGTQATHVYIAPGSYRITFTVRDVNGDAARESTQIDVLARIPSSIQLISDAVAGKPVLFATSALEENAGALSYFWTFSDGQSATGLGAAAIFPVAGMYLATVTVTNDLGAIAGEQIAFHVADAAH